jgi:hypothetical protein
MRRTEVNVVLRGLGCPDNLYPTALIWIGDSAVRFANELSDNEIAAIDLASTGPSNHEISWGILSPRTRICMDNEIAALDLASWLPLVADPQTTRFRGAFSRPERGYASSEDRLVISNRLRLQGGNILKNPRA